MRDQSESIELFIGLAREVGNDPDYPRRAALLSAAANAVSASASTLAQAHEAVGWARKALAISPDGSEDAAYAHLALAQALHQLWHHQDDPSLLDEAIGQYRLVLDGPAAGKLHPVAAYRLAVAALARYGRADPRLAAAIADAQVQAGPGPERHDAAMLQAAAVLEVARMGPAISQERARAIELLRGVALADDARAALRITAARGWGHEALVQGDLADAATAFRAAIDSLPWQLWWANLPSERREQIESVQGVASLAASCAAQAGMTEHAEESLERGRTILWGQVMQMRRAVRQVTVADPVLGERFRQAFSAQEELAMVVGPESYSEAMAEFWAAMKLLMDTRAHPRDLRFRLAAELTDLIAQARQRPGLEGIVRPPSSAELCKAMRGGVAVVVNLSDRGSHALLVAEDGIDNVPLPELDVERSYRRAEEFLWAVHTLGAADNEYGPELERQISQVMADTRQWLWDVIARPVLDRLKFCQVPAPGAKWPRIWWCPTGVLSRLPLHAAGTDEPGGCVIDRVVSSYTISLTALLYSETRTRAAPPPILVLGGSGIPGAPDLKGVRQEIEDLQARFPDQVSSLDGRHATVSAARELIRNSSWIHLACHALPGVSGQPPYLFLHDGRLRIERLGWSASSAAEFAYLSACSTAEAALDAADEAHHLTAALQAAGFPHVIGTLWGAIDDTGAVVAKQYYDRINRAGTVTSPLFAEALHHTLRSIRESGLSPFCRVPYVHYGL